MGTTSSWALLRAALTLVPGAVLVAWGQRLSRAEEPGLGLLALPPGAFLVLYAVQQVVRAWQARPGDAVLTEQGVRFEGGRMGGVALAWAELDPQHTVAEDAKELRLSLSRLLENAAFLFFSTMLANSPELAPEQRLPVRRLRLRAKDGREWLAAVAEKAGEQRSLDALVGSLRAKLGVEPKVEVATPAGVLTCATCRAPLAPGELATASCPFCGHGTPVPLELQQRHRAQRRSVPRGDGAAGGSPARAARRGEGRRGARAHGAGGGRRVGGGAGPALHVRPRRGGWLRGGRRAGGRAPGLGGGGELREGGVDQPRRAAAAHLELWSAGAVGLARSAGVPEVPGPAPLRRADGGAAPTVARRTFSGWICAPTSPR